MNEINPSVEIMAPTRRCAQRQRPRYATAYVKSCLRYVR